jgi:4-hydroxy-tetrahydrodipicolinate synthase
MQISGPIAAAITPSRKDKFQINHAAALEVIDFLIERGATGIALFGATGEFQHFLVEDRMKLAHMAAKRSRVPLIVNVTHTNLADVITLAEHAASVGAAAIMAQPPYYFRYGADEIRQFYVSLMEELDGEIPVLLYHIPVFNNGLPAEVSTDLLLSGKAAGIKDSSGNAPYFGVLAEARRQKEFALVLGNDNLVRLGLESGADAIISGCACAVPELLVGLWNTHKAGETEKFNKLETLLAEFIAHIDAFPGPYGVREAVDVRGLAVGARAIPFSPQTEAKAAEFREWFAGWLPYLQETLAS